jgi:hypothetical protein
MAVKYDHKFSSEDSNFAHIRDSFYILMTMNQFAMKPEVSSHRAEAEGLLRIVLFSKDLQLQGPQESLKDYRHTLAESLRRRRKRGVVPVFISTAWFLFSLAISIQFAFGLIGNNAEAHDLALGLLLGWMPIMIMAGIVDRNPFSVDDVRGPLNDLISLVCQSLQDKTLMTRFLTTLEASDEETEEMKTRVHNIVNKAGYLQHNFLSRFAGQGRLRWHYGCAHSVLSDIENAWIAERGRDWLRDEQEARTKLVLGSNDHGLFWFDSRELWQVSAAFTAVAASCLGAFVLSYFTPTIGLGCRSVGYLIFAIVSFSLLVLEFIVWWLTSEERAEQKLQQPATERTATFFEHAGMTQHAEHAVIMIKHTRSWGTIQRDRIEKFLEHWIPRTWSKRYGSTKQEDKKEKIRARLHNFFQNTHYYSTRQWLHRLFFVPVEIFNTIWLVYIVLAQTFGAYSNCKCVCSLYGFTGGYVDLAQASTTDNPYVQYYWSAGTALSCIVLGLGLIYVVTEWCLQAHISTEKPGNARKGLRKTRRFRRAVSWPRWGSHKAIVFVNNVFGWASQKAIVLVNIFGWVAWIPQMNRQKTLVWTKDVTFDYPKQLYMSPIVERGRQQDEGAERQYDAGEEAPRWGTLPAIHYHTRSDEEESTSTTGLLRPNNALALHDFDSPGHSGMSSYEPSGSSIFTPTDVGESEDEGRVAEASGTNVRPGNGNR